MRGELDHAISDFTTQIETDPQHDGTDLTYYCRALARDEKLDYDGAITDYSKAIELNPELSDAFYFRGLAHYNQNDFDDAIVDFDSTIEWILKASGLSTVAATQIFARMNLTNLSSITTMRSG